MTDQQKYILLGLLGAGGIAYWYFFYGPGMTPAAITTGPAGTGTPASVAPSANGSTVPVPASVQAFVNSWGPKSQALWAQLIPTLSAATVSAQYANLVQILPYWSSNTVAPAALDTAVDNWFNANGFTNLSA